MRSHPHPALVAVAAALAVSPLASARQAYVIEDAGYSRTFELAKDEVSVSTGTKRFSIEKIGPVADLTDMKRVASARARTRGETIHLVLYETDAHGARRGRPRVVTGEVYLRVKPGADAYAIAGEAGAIEVRTTMASRDEYLAVAADSAAALELAENLRLHPDVVAAEPLLAKQRSKKLIPNDTFFTNQFHLRNTGQFGGAAGNDVRVTDVWDTYTGSGVYIAIIDDGLQTAHPDLAANVNTTIDYDINDNDGDPSPVLVDDDHGTACAGIAAARGNNGIGVSGAAPEATLVGLRLISALVDDADEARAINWSNSIIQIKSNSWGPFDDGFTLEGPGTLTRAAFSNTCHIGRGGLGSIIVWAGGNGLQEFDDSNFDGYANTIYTISVAAIDNTGVQSWYSEPGANHIVCATSSGDSSGAEVGTWTTDRTGSAGYASGNYAFDFGGTSSATPLVAGVCALVLEANPALGWRDMQEILIRSATRNDPTDTDYNAWAENGAGIWFSHKYGAGLVNATGAVALAETWTNLPGQVSVSSNKPNLALALPDDDLTGVSTSFTITENLRVEHVVLTADIDHEYRGDVIIQLTSPSNTISILADTRGDASPDGFNNWEFMTVHNWGEMSPGTWTVQIADGGAADIGTVNSLMLTIYGTPTGPVDPDSDGDDLPDQWELDNFGALTNANASTDFDLDGVSDYHEYLSGTQPTNDASFLQVFDNAVDASNGMVITWPGVSGKSYTLSRTTNLVEAAYSVIASNIPGLEPVNIHTDAAPASGSAVYRVELE